VSLTCGARSTVIVDQSTINTAGSQTGFGLGRSGPGRAGHVACCDAATSRPWASTGPWSMTHGPRWTDAPVYGGPRLLLVNRVHPPLLYLWFTCTRFTCGWPARGCSPVFLPRWCSCRRRADCESSWRCWCPIGEGKRLPQAAATAMVGSRWRPGLTKALATANGGSAVLASGEVTFAGSPVARLGR